jgi:hypothetical protein
VIIVIAASFLCWFGSSELAQLCFELGGLQPIADNLKLSHHVSHGSLTS